MGSPLVIGFFMGTGALAGMLAGSLVSGVQVTCVISLTNSTHVKNCKFFTCSQMAISSSNTGGAWDNAKKYIEAGNNYQCVCVFLKMLIYMKGAHGGKGSDPHKAGKLVCFICIVFYKIIK